MISGFRIHSLFLAALLGCHAVVCAQSMNPTDPGARLDDGSNTPGTQNQPPPKASPLLQPWRAAPNLSDNPVEPSPPSPDAEQLESESSLRPMTPSDLNAASESADQPLSEMGSPEDTNNLVLLEDSTSNEQNLPAPPLPGDNMTRAPSMDFSIKDLVETSSEESRHLWRIAPRLFAQTIYDNNIFITKTNTVASMLTSVGLGARVEVGDYRNRERNYANLDYFASYNMYSAAPQENSVDQMLMAEGQYAWTSLTARYKGDAIYINGPSRDTGTFVKGTYFGNTLDFIHDYSPKTTLKLTLGQRGNLFESDGLQNSEFYEVRFSPLYHFTPKLTLGPQAVVGLNTAQNSPDQRYQILNLDLNYVLTGKVNLKAKGGFEANEYASGGKSGLGTSVFDLGAEYTPSAGTALKLIGYRNINNSASLVGQDYIATGISFSASRTIFLRWEPGLQLGYENDQYIGNLPTIQSGRVDNYYYLMPGLVYSFLRDNRLKFKLFYQIRQNVSNQEQTYGWQDNQVGLQFNSSF
jgi:hypothetical protein